MNISCTPVRSPAVRTHSRGASVFLRPALESEIQPSQLIAAMTRQGRARGRQDQR
jgi:hypothetical protein